MYSGSVAGALYGHLDVPRRAPLGREQFHRPQRAAAIGAEQVDLPGFLVALVLFRGLQGLRHRGGQLGGQAGLLPIRVLAAADLGGGQVVGLGSTVDIDAGLQVAHSLGYRLPDSRELRLRLSKPGGLDAAKTAAK